MAISGVIKRSHSLFEMVIEDSKLNETFRTLESALQGYVKAVLRKTGEVMDTRTVMVYEYMPHEPVYKLQRIR